MPAGLLDDIHVLDLSRVLAGPYCTMVLADYGADVIKVEEPGSGDGTRSWGPPWVGDQSAYFLAANRNKRSITVNLKHPAGLDIVRRLAAQSDVVIENFKVGGAARLGLDYATWRPSTRAWSTARSPATGRLAPTATAPATISSSRRRAG
jgi:crotonobetainyl-CoA:carnitine CoA-transferase CaiB-like acyl-CoA transferase